MLTFRTSITFTVMAFIVALAALLIASLGHAGRRVRLHGRNQHKGVRAASDRADRFGFVGARAGDQFQFG